MTNLEIKYSTYAHDTPPQPIRMANITWAGPPQKMKDGSEPQPWHCLPFVEGSTYGMELLYPYETECQVIHAGGTIYFEFDFAREPGGALTGAEFLAFSPVNRAKYYLFNTRLDLQCPPGYILRTEPHPRYFTDETGTVPLPMVGHLQNEWYPRMVFVVFRAPGPGQRHIFRKGEPFVQLLFVPQRVNYELTRMTPEEAAQRRELEKAIQATRLDFADNVWQNTDGALHNNHYKILARAFAREGKAGVEKLVREAAEQQAQALAQCQTVEALLARGAQLRRQHKVEQATEVYARVVRQDPANPEALSYLGFCYTILGYALQGLDLTRRATFLAPRVPEYHRNLADVLRRLGQLPEAEASYRAALQGSPEDSETLSSLAITLAQQGRATEALPLYRQAAARGLPARTHVHMGLVLAHNTMLGEARACFEAALVIEPEFPPAELALQDLAKQTP